MGSARALLRDGVLVASGAALAFLLGAHETASVDTPDVAAGRTWGQHAPNARRDATEEPKTASTTAEPTAARTSGDVELGEQVSIATLASVRGGDGQPVHLGARTNVQDGALVHGLTSEPGYEVAGRTWSVYVGERVSIAPQAQLHGPAWIEDDVYVGMQALVWKARVGRGCVIEPGAKVIGVIVAPGRYVPAGAVITTQAAADALPEITFSYGLKDLNEGVVRANSPVEPPTEAAPPASAARD